MPNLKKGFLEYYLYLDYSFPLRISSVNVTADLVTFPEGIPGKLHFMCNDNSYLGQLLRQWHRSGVFIVNFEHI